MDKAPQSSDQSPSHFKSIHRPDEFIKQEVQWFLTQNGEFDGRNIEVAVHEGVVVLTGDVATKHAKKLAALCLENVSGIIHIENQLKVKRVSRFTDGHSMHGF